jgi:hypothetical protein
LKIVHKIDRLLVINTFQSGKDFVLDLRQSESASLADDTDYNFWHAAMGPIFKANVNRKLYEDGYLIPDCPSIFTSNKCALSKSEYTAPNPVEFKSIDGFQLIDNDVCGPFSNEWYSSSKYLLAVNDDFSRCSWVFFRKQKSDTSITLLTFVNHVER